MPEALPIADADLCTLLANLLDNAVEACGRLGKGERFIRPDLSVRRDLFVLTCSNSAPPRREESGSFPTVKAAPESHGLGIPAMRRVAERYDGVLEVGQEGCVFTLRAVLRLPEAPKLQ